MAIYEDMGDEIDISEMKRQVHQLLGERKGLKTQLEQVKSEFKKVRIRLDRLEKRHVAYQDELRTRRTAALRREAEFIDRIEKIEKNTGLR